MSEPLSLVLEFARNDTPEDPYGFRFKPQDYTLRTAHGGRKRVHLAWSSEFLDDLDALHASSCDPAIVQRLSSLGMSARASTPAEYAATLAEQRAHWTALARAHGVRPQQ